ncbi:MAG: N-acetyltransferase [Thermomicrobiales bacterium]|nr:MAG: N-acetyltransferase [Thermomicrobiales bacterium]
MLAEGRVTLRPICANDLPLLLRWMSDPRLMRHWAQPVPLVTEEQLAQDLAGRFARFDTAGYFMIEREDGAAIGRIEFEQLDERSRSAEVMILIGDPDARGKGYGTEAMVALLRYLFHQRNLHRVYLTVLAWNTPAQRSYAKAGFVVEGRLRDDVYFDGHYHDQLVMGILREEFDARWPPGQNGIPASSSSRTECSS